MQDENTVDTFQTKDFWLSAALLASGHRLLCLQWRDGRAFFIFEKASLCRAAAEAYWRGDLQVAAKDFTDSLRTLKDRMHSEGSGPATAPTRRNQ